VLDADVESRVKSERSSAHEYINERQSLLNMYRPHPPQAPASAVQPNTDIWTHGPTAPAATTYNNQLYRVDELRGGGGGGAAALGYQSNDCCNTQSLAFAADVRQRVRGGGHGKYETIVKPVMSSENSRYQEVVNSSVVPVIFDDGKNSLSALQRLVDSTVIGGGGGEEGGVGGGDGGVNCANNMQPIDRKDMHMVDINNMHMAGMACIDTASMSNIHAAGINSAHMASMNNLHSASWNNVHPASMNTAHMAAMHNVHTASWNNTHATSMNSPHMASTNSPHMANMNSPHMASMNSAHMASMNSAHMASTDSPHMASMNSAHMASMNSPHMASMNSAHMASMNSAHMASTDGRHMASMNSPHMASMNNIYMPSVNNLQAGCSKDPYTTNMKNVDTASRHVDDIINMVAHGVMNLDNLNTVINTDKVSYVAPSIRKTKLNKPKKSKSANLNIGNDNNMVESTPVETVKIVDKPDTNQSVVRRRNKKKAIPSDICSFKSDVNKSSEIVDVVVIEDNVDVVKSEEVIDSENKNDFAKVDIDADFTKADEVMKDCVSPIVNSSVVVAVDSDAADVKIKIDVEDTEVKNSLAETTPTVVSKSGCEKNVEKLVRTKSQGSKRGSHEGVPVSGEDVEIRRQINSAKKQMDSRRNSIDSRRETNKVVERPLHSEDLVRQDVLESGKGEEEKRVSVNDGSKRLQSDDDMSRRTSIDKRHATAKTSSSESRDKRHSSGHSHRYRSHDMKNVSNVVKSGDVKEDVRGDDRYSHTRHRKELTGREPEARYVLRTSVDISL